MGRRVSRRRRRTPRTRSFKYTYDATEVKVQSLRRPVLLQKIDDARRAKEIRVLLRNIDDGLEILADIDFQHLIQAFQRKLDSQGAEEADEELLGDLVGLNCSNG